MNDKINIKTFICNELSVNAFVLYSSSGNCIIVDPGCINPEQCIPLKEFIIETSLNPLCIINTHGHFDHVAGNAFMKRAFDCPVCMHKEDLFLLEKVNEQAALFQLISVG